MELTEITFKKGNLEVEMEKNSGGSYSVAIKIVREPDEPYEKSFCDFRTDEVDLEDLIKTLEFCRDYQFIQGEK